MSRETRYKRVLVKLSGEGLCCPGGFGIDPEAIGFVVDELVSIIEMGVQLGLVVGGGNFLRGRDLESLTGDAESDSVIVQRATADYMGMLATVMNALALRDALESRGVRTCAQSAIAMNAVCEPFAQRRAVNHLSKGTTVIFAAGTGNPFFTTDTCASLRARQIKAQILLKATKVDGVFDSDPQVNPNARKYDRLTYEQVLAEKLGVMDLTAISMCMENEIPILVFNFGAAGNLKKAVYGENVGTLIGN